MYKQGLILTIVTGMIFNNYCYTYVTIFGVQFNSSHVNTSKR